MKSKYIVFTAIGFELVGIILACIFIGHKLDEHYGTQGLALIGFSVAGLAGWLIHVVQLLKRIEAIPDDNSDSSP